ncbi:alpha/beta fold hydrolase [Candidatus Poribacteria bacterium]|nr:alpha/beta fold hydrolase [Candidatus Poribacteria bacterium]
MKSIWDLQITISRRLLVWSGLSISAGLILILTGDSFWRGFGIQAAVWGAIDAAIALVGMFRTRRKRFTHDTRQQMSREARNLKRILLVNFGLDVIYMVVGAILVYFRSEAAWRGHGWGVIIQGGFLFFFDFIHAQSVPPAVNPKPFKAFQGDEHKPFFMQGKKPAALLIHGFPGTPAEVRSLGDFLHDAGWTVEGILLPGFGSDIMTLDERSYEEWVQAVKKSLKKLKKEHYPVLLLGYSMGGAVSIVASSNSPPDGLILIAPFWRIFSPLKRFIGTILKPFLPRYFQPLKEIDISDPKIQSNIRDFLPDVDLDDPEIQEDIRNTTIPVAMVNQVLGLGKKAYKNAKSLNLPVLVIQGQKDELVKPELTFKLKKRLDAKNGSQVRYIMINGEHDIINTSNPVWPEVEEAILAFAENLKNKSQTNTS